MLRALIFFLAAAPTLAATFGTVITVVGEPTDLVLDEARGRLYVVNSTQSRVEVYSTAQRKLVSPISVSAQPLTATISRSGKYLYVTSYGTSTLNVIDLDSQAVVQQVSLPAAPEGIAVGADERVLISTVSAQNQLILYDPSTGTWANVATSLPAPSTPSTIASTVRSRLAASRDGSIIVGLNNPNTTTRQVFVYETASGSVLRSRSVSNISNVLSISPDGKRFMAGLSMFDTDTLMILAQQNTANSAYPFATSANFNTQSNQGGSVFAADGSVMYSAFNIAPVNSTTTNVSQLLVNDPDNLLIQLGIQLPENLIGAMRISSDGGNIYALSQSGITWIPMSTLYNNPVVVPQSSVVLLSNDQCGVSSPTASVVLSNLGQGRYSASAAVQTTGPTSTTGLGGNNGPGGGGPGGGFPINVPGGGTITLPGNGATTTTQQTAVSTAAPSIATRSAGNDTQFDFTFTSAAAAKSIGTGAPTDFVVSSPQAVNIPPLIRVFQNYRSTEANGDIVTIPMGASTTEGLVDIVADQTRQRLYMANSGLNRVEVFDMVQKQLLAPIKVGQLPRSLALSPDGNTLYVANTGGENIGIIDLDQGVMTGRVKFPLTAYNAGAALVTPSVIAASVRGLQVVMSSGALWSVTNGIASPRSTSVVIGTSTLTSPRAMVATPGGEYVLLLDGNGKGYLYDAMTDDYVLSEQIISTPIQGYYGALGAGPGGAYFLVNGKLVNQALTTIATAPSSLTVSSVSPVSGTMFARFVQPTRSSATAVLTASPTVELVDATTGATRGPAVATLEGPLSTQVGTQRANINQRTMAVDARGSTAYLLTSSGLSIVSLTAAGQQTAPSFSASGVVNAGNYTTALAQGSVVSIYGKNLASQEQIAGSPLPTVMGGVCLTMDGAPVPLSYVSSDVVNFQISPTTTAAKHTLVLHNLDRKAASSSQSITVSKYAPAVLMDGSGDAMIYHADGRQVSKSAKAKRDEQLAIYATGLGVTTGGKVTAGNPAPSDPLAVTATVQVYFGDPSYKQAEMIVNWSGLAPGLIGIYQINVTVPGAHISGDTLPVTLKIGGVSTSTTAAVKPQVSVE